MCSGVPSRGSFDVVSPCWVRTARSNLGQTWSTLVKPQSNLVKLGQNWSNLPELHEMCVRPYLEAPFMWRISVGSDWLGSDRLVLRVDTRENPGGKNGVMIVASSLFGVSWHKERRVSLKVSILINWLINPRTFM